MQNPFISSDSLIQSSIHSAMEDTNPNASKIIQTEPLHMPFNFYINNSLPGGIEAPPELPKDCAQINLNDDGMTDVSARNNVNSEPNLSASGISIDQSPLQMHLDMQQRPIQHVSPTNLTTCLDGTPVVLPEARCEITKKGRKSWKGKYSGPLREKARELKQQGMSYQAISKALQVGSPGTVRRWISSDVGSKETLCRRGRRRKLPREVEEAIIQLYEDKIHRGLKCSARELADQINNDGLISSFAETQSSGCYKIQSRFEIKPQQIGEILRRHNANITNGPGQHAVKGIDIIQQTTSYQGAGTSQGTMIGSASVIMGQQSQLIVPSMQGSHLGHIIGNTSDSSVQMSIGSLNNSVQMSPSKDQLGTRDNVFPLDLPLDLGGDLSVGPGREPIPGCNSIIGQV